MRKINLCVKRCIDFVGSLIGIVVLSPVFLVIAIMIKTSSEGPVFFKQERLGKDGKVFKIIKFRTMIVNAEHIGDGLRVREGDDLRITKIGRVLRKTSLDELPQLLNVLNGSMSLVGPRPPATYHPYAGYKAYPDWAKKRFQMRPGITGLAQATVRNSASWDERIRIDNQYVDRFDIWLDIKILCMTVMRVVKSEDIYAPGETQKDEEKVRE